jgi:hypothetical protein
MDDTQKELQQEEELLKTSKEEEVKAKIIEQFGLHETDDADLIEKLTKARLEDQKNFGELVKQKRNWREKATKTPEPPKPTVTSTLTSEQLRQQARDEAKAELELRDLEELNLPDDLKSEVQLVAKIQGISIRKAAQDPYIVSKKDAWEKKQKEEEATISRKNNSAAAQSKTFSVDNPPQVDMSTEEGRKTWADYKAFLKTQKL